MKTTSSSTRSFDGLIVAKEPVQFSQEELDFLLDNIEHLSPEEASELLQITQVLEEREFAHKCRDDLIEFCKAMQEGYKVGTHHRHLASLLMDCEKGEKDRVTVSIAPRHGKSQMTSIFFAAWFLGKNPNKQVMLVSHTADLAVDFGRKVRNLFDTPEYQRIFPGVHLAVDSKSAGRWNTNKGGVFYATGVGSSLAGRGADLLIVDDPHSEQDMLAGNFDSLETAYKWFLIGARTRLMPGGRVVVVACMTGDTRVLMGDGKEKELQYITPGDMVMSYNGTNLSPQKVLNWINHGSDHVYTIRLNNGNLIKANARHPFLVIRDGVELWVRVQGLKVGDNLASLKGVIGSQNLKAQQVDAKYVKTACNVTEKKLGWVQSYLNQSLAKLKGVLGLQDLKAQAISAPHAYLGSATIEKTPNLHIKSADIGVSGRVWSVAQPNVVSRLEQKACAPAITTNIIGLPVRVDSPPTNSETPDLNTGMEYLSKNTTACWSSRGENAQFAKSPLAKQTYQKHGTGDSPSTTATILSGYEPYCATFATSWSVLESTKKDYDVELGTYELTPAQILSIEYCGEEDVFDIEVEKTENFIANGVVSHNTRWHKSDLIGKLINDMAKDSEVDQYHVVEFPAILHENTENEKALWPEFFDLEALRRTRSTMPAYQWNAQYQQNPTGDTSSICKREWWRKWEDEQPPRCEYIIQAIDAAAELNNRSDYTSITTWGVFWNDETAMNNIILLNAVRERMEFPELKEKVLEEYNYWQPDSCLVEKKSSGTALYQELRRMGVPVGEYTPHRGSINNPNNKYVRLNAVIDMVREGIVWVPHTRWAEQLVEELAEFPYGDHDDAVDTTIMALMRFRQGGFAQLSTDQKDEPPMFRRRSAYY